MKKLIIKRFNEAAALLELTVRDEKIIKTMSAMSQAIISVYNNSGKIFIAGNGGSAADAQHITAELVSRFYRERKALAAESLTVNTSDITAIANDYDFSVIFSRQLEANARKGDIFWGISTSGNSKNIISAIITARDTGMKIIGFTGSDGGKMSDMCDLIIKIPSKDTPRIQEQHILIAHIICELVENGLFA
ncbi:SIS domain-containing protein [Candidatus Acidulodesulfobacterium sp. H_13]|uniref:D-sedoheptulose-7-phosphate isomerase n=1 Tax=Candidatus Acidulodesulfobacterium sp. H_13 TaxID=3395470 RepID=UPI003AF91DB0